jgi:hypothetical protein
MLRTGVASVVVSVVALAACSSGGGGSSPSLSMDDLDKAGKAKECPVDLAKAADKVGLDPQGKVAVDVERGSGKGDVFGGDSAIEAMGGIYIECTATTHGHKEVRAVVFGSKHRGAANILLPQLSHDLALPVDQLRVLAERAAKTDVGDRIDLDTDAPGAVELVDIDGAQSGVIYVFADGATRDQAEKILDEL